ncbi:MAG: ribonuclease HI [Candidatus Dadabacteria bacterium]|nr:MAG: ribonuclease HI [Candidatus Dadabacteria bacterium]
MAENILTLQQVLERFSEGPQTGVFADGSCSGNPGPGGWGVVHVENGKIIQQDYGHEPKTTNNRMELTALIRAYSMLPNDASICIYTDSNLCVRTINEWAEGWEKRGWKRKTGPIANLELVKEAFRLAKEHPYVKLKWIKAHTGYLWNEYANSLANAWARDEI